MNSTGPAPLIPKRILIVEDDLVAGHTLRLALSVDHHVVDLAADSEEALSLFETNQYDLVIADFKLPRMDGLELAEIIKQNAPSVPVILLTAYAETVKAQMGGQVSNVDALLGKPVSLAELHEAMSRVSPASQSAAPVDENPLAFS
jgi:CheY-like chemotaxis protein